MSIFKFKQFEVDQSHSAQKIGTDSVLLGAWSHKNSPTPPYKILDVGTGTGVLSLMLAQRFSKADIEAVELDEAAFEEATSNFENSPWADRMFCYHASFEEFYEEDDYPEKYDLIISNPPYFESSSNNNEVMDSRATARFDDALPFEQLVYGVYKMLEFDGVFSCIIPSDRENNMIKITDHFQLKASRVTEVKGNANAPVKRCLMEFRFRESEFFQNNTPVRSELIVEKERHVYTDDAYQLFKDFYLKL